MFPDAEAMIVVPALRVRIIVPGRRVVGFHSRGSSFWVFLTMPSTGRAPTIRSEPDWTLPQATELLGMQGPLVGPEGPTVGQPVLTPGGITVVTGGLGSMETTTLPGNAVTGLLENNGNGTSTLIVPGGPPQVFPTPR
jgi:hypothetical protein